MSNPLPNIFREKTVSITEKEKKFYQENGYLVLESVLSDDIINVLEQHGRELIKEFVDKALESKEEITTFSTKNQQSNAYFLDSADKISFFWEPTAFENHTSKEDVPKEMEDSSSSEKNFKKDINPYHAINKIGHNLHELDPIFSRFCLEKTWRRICESLDFQDAVIAQSMYIVKAPELGGEVRVHQDSTFVNTKPLSCLAFWFPLEDVHQENACLWVAPKSHTYGLSSRFRLTKDKTDTIMTPPDEDEQAPWKNDTESPFPFPSGYIPLECPKGSLVLLHGSLLHFSKHNHSQKPRDVMSFHVVDQKCKWSEENWIMKKELGSV